MRFRARIFLAVLLPAGVLVLAAVAVALVKIARASENAAREEFRRTREALEAVLKDRARQLEPIRQIFMGPRYRAMVEAAVQSKSSEGLRGQVLEQWSALRFEPDFYCMRGPEGEQLLRESSVHRSCPEGCRHPFEEWTLAKPIALAEIDGQPFLAVSSPYLKGDGVEGMFIVATQLNRDLERLAAGFAVDLALLAGERVVYSSRPDWSPALGSDGNVTVSGKRYLAVRARPEASELDFVVLRSMAKVDEDRGYAMTAGVAGFAVAVLVATLVSLKVSRRISRPVEALVGAARQVGEGDFTVKVAIPGRDEMARLGQAFNDMTGGLLKRQEIMEKTLSRDVAEELLKGVELGGERRELSVLFMDIRGFTSATEGMDPAEVVGMLNTMMDRLAAAVHENGGIVNKYLGDGLMAVFGAPKALDRHALCAVRAGLEMQRLMDGWNAERLENDLPTLQIGIGVNSGIAVGGKVGSRQRLEYTVIGEEVNLASRVCGKAAPGQVLITAKTRRQLQDQVKVKELDPVEVKGLSYPVQVFEVLE